MTGLLTAYQAGMSVPNACNSWPRRCAKDPRKALLRPGAWILRVAADEPEGLKGCWRGGACAALVREVGQGGLAGQGVEGQVRGERAGEGRVAEQHRPALARA